MQAFQWRIIFVRVNKCIESCMHRHSENIFHGLPGDKAAFKVPGALFGFDPSSFEIIPPHANRDPSADNQLWVMVDHEMQIFTLSCAQQKEPGEPSFQDSVSGVAGSARTQLVPERCLVWLAQRLLPPDSR